MDIQNTANMNDLGVLFGYSLFETILVQENSQVFLLEKHIDRLFESMKTLDFNINFDKQYLYSTILDYINKDNLKNKILRITVTFGNEHEKLMPTLSLLPRPNPYNKDVYERGIKLTISNFKRDQNSPILIHKSGNRLENHLELQRAVKTGFNDSIFLNMNNEITETTKSNIFFVSNGVLHTPDITCGLLPGIIRDWVLKAADSLGLKTKQGCYTLDSLLNSEEVFVTNSVMGIMPVYIIEDKLFDNNSRNFSKILINKLNTLGYFY